MGIFMGYVSLPEGNPDVILVSEKSHTFSHLLIWDPWDKNELQVWRFEEMILKSRWWFQIFVIFTPKIGEDSHFD